MSRKWKIISVGVVIYLAVLLFFLLNPDVGSHFFPKLVARIFVSVLISACAMLIGAVTIRR
jgi:hypothetical protein